MNNSTHNSERYDLCDSFDTHDGNIQTVTIVGKDSHFRSQQGCHDHLFLMMISRMLLIVLLLSFLKKQDATDSDNDGDTDK